MVSFINSVVEDIVFAYRLIKAKHIWEKHKTMLNAYRVHYDYVQNCAKSMTLPYRLQAENKVNNMLANGNLDREYRYYKKHKRVMGSL